MTKKINKGHPENRLGEILLEERLISREQLEKAVTIQKDKGGHLSEILVKRGLAKEEDVAYAISRQFNIPFISNSDGPVSPAEGQGLEELVSKQFALRNTIIPLAKDLNSLTCAMFDPFDYMLIDELRKITGCEIDPVIATKSDILKAIEGFYNRSRSNVHGGIQKTRGISIQSNQPTDNKDDVLSLDSIIARAEDASVVKLVDLILWQAIDKGASDIHIEPFKDRISLRYRIDGKLYEIQAPPLHQHLPIVSRIKILSKLDIAEKRLPQDGNFVVNTEDKTMDLRISMIPTIYGEKVVIRILDRTGFSFDLDKMGFDYDDLIVLRKAINSPYGLVLITGPTGSGKSTTLYAILQEIKSTTLNIMTVEDPVEYRLDGINQIQVKPEIGLTFAAALRSFLRQDPDIMLVGEVRDLETAEICVRSALTGHLVMSTLHTNDAPSAITRLMDIGVEPYLLAPSLLIVVGQRLVRKLCPECKDAYEPSIKELGNVKIKPNTVVYRAKGCLSCGNTGYKGRTLIAEVMPISEDMKEFISSGTSYKEIRNIARKNGMSTLYESGLRKIEQGITSLEEVLGVTLGIER